MAFEWSDPVDDQGIDTTELERVARLFRTDDGEKLLADWTQQFLFALRTDMNPSPYKTGFYDGQAHLVKAIHECIRKVDSLNE